MDTVPPAVCYPMHVLHTHKLVLCHYYYYYYYYYFFWSIHGFASPHRDAYFTVRMNASVCLPHTHTHTQASVGLRPNKHGHYKHRTVIPSRSLGDHQAQITYVFQIQNNIHLEGSCDIPPSTADELNAKGEVLSEFWGHFQTVA